VQDWIGCYFESNSHTPHIARNIASTHNATTFVHYE